MSSTSIPPQRPKNPTHFGGEGLYESPSRRTSNGSGKARWKWSHTAPRSMRSILQRAGRDPRRLLIVPAVIAVGALVWLVASALRSERD